MSFILEALKKSEKQQQKKNGHVVRTVYEPVPGKKRTSRLRGIGFLVLLLMNVSLLAWFFSPWQPAKPFAESKQQVVLDRKRTEAVDNTMPATLPASDAETGHSQIVPARSQQPVKSLPVPRNDNKVYLLSQLPLSIQKRLPTLKMSLHAFNRDQPGASLVQLNDRILREGDRVTDRLRLEKITADGIILHYDGYHFLLPRRGN